jgi:hypothetical protein
MGLHINLAKNPPVLLQTAPILNYGNNVTEREHIRISPVQSLKLIIFKKKALN